MSVIFNYFKDGTLKDIYKKFKEEVERLQEFWAAMDDLDSNCWVLDPASPRHSDCYRRIALGKKHTYNHFVSKPLLPKASRVCELQHSLGIFYLCYIIREREITCSCCLTLIVTVENPCLWCWNKMCNQFLIQKLRFATLKACWRFVKCSSSLLSSSQLCNDQCFPNTKAFKVALKALKNVVIQCGYLGLLVRHLECFLNFFWVECNKYADTKNNTRTQRWRKMLY